MVSEVRSGTWPLQVVLLADAVHLLVSEDRFDYSRAADDACRARRTREHGLVHALNAVAHFASGEPAGQRRPRGKQLPPVEHLQSGKVPMDQEAIHHQRLLMIIVLSKMLACLYVCTIRALKLA